MDSLSTDVTDKKQVTLTALNVFYPQVIYLYLPVVDPTSWPPSGRDWVYLASMCTLGNLSQGLTLQMLWT